MAVRQSKSDPSARDSRSESERSAEGAEPALDFDRWARMLLDDGPPLCITDHGGRRLYANAGYRRIAEALAAAGLSPELPARPGGASASELAEAEHSLHVDSRSEHYRIRRRRLPHAPGSEATATFFTPVTAQRRASQASAAAAERLEDITRLVSDWVWETDRNLVLTFVSPRVNEALGFHQRELTGRPLPELLLRPADALRSLTTALGRRPFRDVAVEIADRAGQVRHFRLSGLPVFCSNTGVFLGFRGTAHDVTELKWQTDALLRAKEAAELGNRTKGEFLANMSHELRTPLNAIIGFSEVMAGEILGPIGNAQYQSYCRDIGDSAKHLLNLINDILDAAKIDAGRMTLSETAFDPTSVADAVRRLILPRAERAGIKLTLHAETDPPCLFADQTKLRQILTNLLSNAVKFTPAGGRVDLRVQLGESGEYLFFVTDTGIGIAAADIPRALAPFGQVDTRLSRKFEGTGLGLPLAKSLAELHGGSFHLASEPEIGTTVTVSFPAERVRPR